MRNRHRHHLRLVDANTATVADERSARLARIRREDPRATDKLRARTRASLDGLGIDDIDTLAARRHLRLPRPTRVTARPPELTGPSTEASQVIRAPATAVAPQAPIPELHAKLDAGAPSGSGPRVRVVAGLHADDLVELGSCLAGALELAVDDRLVVTHRIGVDSAALAAALFADADVVVLDGHGIPSRRPPVMARLPLDVPTLQRWAGRDGIRAPVLILGACRAGGPNIAAALRRCLARPSTALVASRARTFNSHAVQVFPQVLRALAPLGPGLDPVEVVEVLRGVDVLSGAGPAGWGATVLHREALAAR